MAVFAFIDSQNLNLGVQSSGWKLDFGKFRIYLRDKYQVEKAYLFIGYIPQNENLYTYLKSAGYTVILKPTVQEKKRGGVNIKGNVDAELVLHAMIEYANYQQAVIVTGDGDFHCLIEYLEQNHKLLKIIAPNRKYSSLLRRFSPKIVLIDLFKNKVEIKQKEAFPRDETLW